MRVVMGKANDGDFDVRRIEEVTANLLGKDAGLFVPSSTMANEVAINVHTKPGDGVIADRFSHISELEGGSPALVSGATLHRIDAERGIISEEDVLAEIRPDDPLSSRVRLVVAENAHNLRGGTIWPLGKLMAMSDISERLGLAVHLDGSRLLNAVVGSGICAREFAYCADSVSMCFYKGLGVPFGAALAGSKEFIDEARRVLRQLGGHMEGAGIFAAGALYALDHNVERLAEDNGNARALAERLCEERSLDVDLSLVETNIVSFEVKRVGTTPCSFVESLAEEGVRMNYFRDRVRAVTHMGITRREVLHAADAVHRMLVDIRMAA
jgi:threonine aldolase